MKIRIVKPGTSILVALFLFFRGLAQDGLDIVNLYLSKVAEVDRNAFHHHIKTVSLSIRDSGMEKTVVRKQYDKKGYLARRIDYSQKSKPDSIETVIKRTLFGETVIEYKITTGDYYVDDEDNPVPALLSYLDILDTEGNAVLVKKYKMMTDSTVRITTSINNRVEQNTEFILLDNVKQQPVMQYGDTAYAHDTLVLINRQRDTLGDLSMLKAYFVKGIATPVRAEVLRYSKDSLVYQRVEVNEFNRTKRLVNHAVYQGPPLVQYESKKVIYNNFTNERTETEDNNPTTGAPQRIWRYDKKGRIVYFEKVSQVGRDKGSVVYKYNKKGLLEEEVFLIKDIPYRYIYYKYTYH